MREDKELRSRKIIKQD